MARIPLLDLSDPGITGEARASLLAATKSRGRLLNIHRAMANRPEAARAFQQLVETVYRGRSSLAPRHGELAYLTATAINNCHY